MEEHNLNHINVGSVGPTSEALDMIIKNDIDGLATLISVHKLDVDFVDENGMTPLQHACYKGNKDIAQMLIDQGADVNSGKHEHGYTALHFAALSGNADLCQLLLLAGAKSNVNNSVGRTAAQMAAFVGNHACVAVINNFIPREDVDYFTVAHGVVDKPHLSPFLAAPVHKFIMNNNMHPVRVAMSLNGLLLEHIDQVQNVLEMMRDREARRGSETNEVTAFKLHYLSFVVADIALIQRRQKQQRETEKKDLPQGGTDGDKCGRNKPTVQADKDEEREKKSDCVEVFIKNMLKPGRAGDAHITEMQDRFLRECVRDYPYRGSNLLRQMVTSLAARDSPHALAIVVSAINGQRGFFELPATGCSTCGEQKAPKKCSKCKAVQYCDRECQRLHWFVHKKACARLGSSNSPTANNTNCNTDTSTIQDDKSAGSQPTSQSEQDINVDNSTSRGQILSGIQLHNLGAISTPRNGLKDEE